MRIKAPSEYQLMRSRLLATGIISLGMHTAPALSDENPTEQQALPNIVILLADDLGIGDPRCYNPDSKIPTPHIDQLAQEGMRFMDAHTPAAICTPTRYALLTDRYCWRTHLKQGVLWSDYAPALIEPKRTTLPSLLQQQGYHTGCIGKWHLGFNWASFDGEPVTHKHFAETNFEPPVERGPSSVGFDYSMIIPASLDIPPYLWLENGCATEQPTKHDPGSKQVWSGGGGFWRKGLRAPGFKFNEVLPTITQHSVAYIDACVKDDKPFFLYVPFASPPTPEYPMIRSSIRVKPASTAISSTRQTGPSGRFLWHWIGMVLRTTRWSS